MSMGQEGDTRRFRKAKKTDYSAGVRAAMEVKPVTKWTRCVVCKQAITGLNYRGKCHSCFNDNVILPTPPVVPEPPTLGAAEWDISVWDTGYWWEV